MIRFSIVQAPFPEVSIDELFFYRIEVYNAFCNLPIPRATIDVALHLAFYSEPALGCSVLLVGGCGCRRFFRLFQELLEYDSKHHIK